MNSAENVEESNRQRDALASESKRRHCQGDQHGCEQRRADERFKPRERIVRRIEMPDAKHFAQDSYQRKKLRRDAHDPEAPNRPSG